MEIQMTRLECMVSTIYPISDPANRSIFEPISNPSIGWLHLCPILRLSRQIWVLLRPLSSLFAKKKAARDKSSGLSLFFCGFNNFIEQQVFYPYCLDSSEFRTCCVIGTGSCHVLKALHEVRAKTAERKPVFSSWCIMHAQNCRWFYLGLQRGI